MYVYISEVLQRLYRIFTLAAKYNISPHNAMTSSIGTGSGLIFLIWCSSVHTYMHFITSPAGAVAKYCNEHACVCLSVCEDISGTTRAIITNFSVYVAYGRGSVLFRQGDEIPRGRGSSGGFLPY